MHPTAFRLGPLTVHWYGVLVALGFLVGLWNAGRRARRSGMAPEPVVDLGPWLIVGTIIGARALYVLTYWRPQFADKPWWEIFMVHHGGLVFYGGLIGASVACLIYVGLKRLDVWPIADVLAPSIALGTAIGRLGCLMNGCCYGRPCTLPWAIRFPPSHESEGIPVHPTQIYDALANLALYALLAWGYRRKQWPGQIFAAYLVGYALLRSAVELFRGDYTQAWAGGWVTPAHLLSVWILAAGLLLFWRLPRRRRS